MEILSSVRSYTATGFDKDEKPAAVPESLVLADEVKKRVVKGMQPQPQVIDHTKTSC